MVARSTSTSAGGEGWSQKDPRAACAWKRFPSGRGCSRSAGIGCAIGGWPPETEASDADLPRSALDLVWRVTALHHLFDAADSVLESAVAFPLTRADLGVRRPTPGMRARATLFTTEAEIAASA